MHRGMSRAEADHPGATPAPGTAYLASPRRAVTADLLHPGHRAGAVVP